MKYHCYEIHLNYYLKFFFTSADNLAGNADMFRSRARGLHKKMWWNNCKVRETNNENCTIFNLLKYTYYSIKQIPHLYFTIYYFAKCITMKKWFVFQMKLALVVIILIVLLVIISKSHNTLKPYFIIIFHFKCNFFGLFQGY